MRKGYIFRLILISMLMVALLLFTNTANGAISEMDNKYLADFPSFNQSVGQFFRDLNPWLSDRLGGRAKFIKFNTLLNDKLFQKMEHPNYEQGEGGYVFGELKRFEMDFDFLDQFTDLLKDIEDYCVDRDVKFIYLLNPAKYSVYTEYLPDGYVMDNKRLEYLQDLLVEKEITHVDNTPLFISLKDEDQVFNIKYDAGHWNSLGAFYGVNNLLLKMGDLDDRIVPNDIKDYHIDKEVKTSLPVSEFKIYEEVPKLVDNSGISFESDRSMVEEIEISNQHRYFNRIVSSNKNGVRLLSFQGSYFNGIGHPFLARAVEEYVAIHNYQNLIEFDYYFNIFRPDIVLVTTAEYATTGGYFDFKRMNAKTFNPALDKELFKQVDLRNIKVDIEIKTNITSVTFSFPEPIKYGYYVEGEKVYDIKFRDDHTGEITFLNENRLGLDGQLYLVDESSQFMMVDGFGID